MNGWREIFPANGNENKSVVLVLRQHRLKTKTAIKNTNGIM